MSEEKNNCVHSCLILIDSPSPAAFKQKKLFTDWERDYLEKKLLKNGIHPKDVIFKKLFDLPTQKKVGKLAKEGSIEYSKKFLGQFKVIIPLGDLSLNSVSNQSNMNKWKCSPHLGRDGKTWIVGTPHPSEITKVYEKQVYIELAMMKAKLILDGKEPKGWDQRKMILGGKIEETISYLEERVARADEICLDIETGRGQVNTIGFAVNPDESISIPCLPSSYSAQTYHKLWSVLARILESDQKKIAQNILYEGEFLARYGIRLKGDWHDTMVGQGMIYPDFPKGLGEIGALFTHLPYWKDENSGSWNKVRDWNKHMRYNCMDVLGTFEAYLGQKDAITSLGVEHIFSKKMKLMHEYLNSIILKHKFSEDKVREYLTHIEKENEELSEKMKEHNPTFNINSTKDIKDLVLSQSKPKMKLFKKKVGGAWKDSVGKEHIKKLVNKYEKHSEILCPILRMLEIKDEKRMLAKIGEETEFSIDPYSDEFGFPKFRGHLKFDQLCQSEKLKEILVPNEEDGFICEIEICETEDDLIRLKSKNPENAEISRELWEFDTDDEVHKTKCATGFFGEKRMFFSRLIESYKKAKRFKIESAKRVIAEHIAFRISEKLSGDSAVLWLDSERVLISGTNVDEVWEALSELDSERILKGLSGDRSPKVRVKFGNNWGEAEEMFKFGGEHGK